MTVANCYSWCCAEGLKYWSINNSKHKEWNKKWHSNASDSRQPPAFSSFSLSSIIRPWRCRSWRPWLKDLRRSHSEMTRDEAKMSDELPWHFLFWATEVTKTCLWPQLVTSMYIHIYIYILKKNASFGSNEMLKNKERPWTMFQWHTCPSNRVMRQNRTMWQTQKKPTIGDDFYHLLYLYSYWGWFIAGFTTVPHYFQHTHTYIYNIFCNIYITIIYYHLPWFSIPPR